MSTNDLGDHTQPVIDQQQALTNQLMGKSKKLTPEELAKVQKDFDIKGAFDKAVATADKNSPVFKQKGLDDLNNYTQYWYDQVRAPGSYDVQQAMGTTPKTPEQQAADLTKSITDAVNTAVTGVKSQTDAVVGQLQQQNTALTGMISSQANQFQKSQADLMAQFNKAQADATKQMADLIGSQNAVGQAAKKPSYARALAQNKALNSGGLGSTMLTGATGVAPTALTLGRTSLLGA